MDKNILIIGSNSELAHYTIEELKQNPEYKIFATSRQTGVMDEKIHEFHLDISNEMDFIHLKEKINNIKFDTIINFAGIAIAGAVEELNETELKKQLDINLFGLLRIIKYFCPYLKEKGKLINISSMASYGIFPFLSPYCISKAACDILLNLYSIESNIKTQIDRIINSNAPTQDEKMQQQLIGTLLPEIIKSPEMLQKLIEIDQL